MLAHFLAWAGNICVIYRLNKNKILLDPIRRLEARRMSIFETCYLYFTDLWKNTFSSWLNQLEGDSFRFWALCIFGLYVLELFLISNLIADGSTFDDFYSPKLLSNNVIALAIGIACTGYLAGAHPSQVEFSIIMKVVCTVTNLGCTIFLWAFAIEIWNSHKEAVGNYFLLGLILVGSVLIFLKIILFEIWWFYQHPYTYGVFLSYRKEKKCDPSSFSAGVITDEKIAKGIKKVLEFCGIRVFMDQTELALGQYWFDGLQNAITSSFLFVPVISKSGIKKGTDGSFGADGIDYVAWEYLVAIKLKQKRRIHEIQPIFIGRETNINGIYEYRNWKPEYAPVNFQVEAKKTQRKVIETLQKYHFTPPSNFTVESIFLNPGINWRQLIEGHHNIDKFYGAAAILREFCKLNNPGRVFNEQPPYSTNAPAEVNVATNSYLEFIQKWVISFSISVLKLFQNCTVCLSIERICCNCYAGWWFFLLELCDEYHFRICYLNFITLFLQLLVASIIISEGNDIFNSLNEYATIVIFISIALGVSGYLAGNQPVYEWRAIRLFCSLILVIFSSVIIADAFRFWGDDSVTTANFLLAFFNLLLSIVSGLKSVQDTSILLDNYSYGVYLSYSQTATADVEIAMTIKECLEYFGIKVYIASHRRDESHLEEHAKALSESILFVPIISKEGQKRRFEALRVRPSFDYLLWEYFMAERLRKKNRIFGIVPIVVARDGSGYADFFENFKNYAYSVPTGQQDCEVAAVSKKVKEELLRLRVSPPFFDKMLIGTSLDLTNNQGLEWDKLKEHAAEKNVPEAFLATMSIMKALAKATKFEAFSHRDFVKPMAKSTNDYHEQYYNPMND